MRSTPWVSRNITQRRVTLEYHGRDMSVILRLRGTHGESRGILGTHGVAIGIISPRYA